MIQLLPLATRFLGSPILSVLLLIGGGGYIAYQKILINTTQAVYTSKVEQLEKEIADQRERYLKQVSERDQKIMSLTVTQTNLENAISYQNEAITKLANDHDKELREFQSRLSSAEATNKQRAGQIAKMKNQLNIPKNCDDSINWLKDRAVQDSKARRK